MWTTENIPNQTGRVALITGANTGLGYETALGLALHGAKTILACRNTEKGEAAAKKINDEVAKAKTGGKGAAEFQLLDLSDLDQVKEYSTKFMGENTRLDLLILNAGVMMTPYTRTKQDHELQIGTNYFGHAALTKYLLPLLTKTEGSRIVVLSSSLHKQAKAESFDDLDWKKRKYDSIQAYATSKLADLVFAKELSRRLVDAGIKSPQVAAAHPGYAATELQRTVFLFRILNYVLAQSSAQGALPTLRAATDPSVKPGSYWGPDGIMNMRGNPVVNDTAPLADDPKITEKLFEETKALTGLTFDFTPK